MFRIAVTTVALAMILIAGWQPTTTRAQDDSETPGLGGSASISGTVTFTDGSASVNRPVEWRPSGDSNGGSTAQTNSDGAFVIEGLKDGEYFVGYFDPARVPADQNPDVVPAPDVAGDATDEMVEIGIPAVRVVTIVDGATVSGIDFVITNIGDESVEGPDTGDDGGTGGLPVTGTSGSAIPAHDSSPSWLMPLLLVSAALVGFGALFVAWPRLKRGRTS